MSRLWRLGIIAGCVLVVLLGVATLGSRLTIDAGAYKHRVETIASDPMGLRVSIDGRLAVAFTGDVLLVMRDVHVRNSDGAEVLSAERAMIAVAAFPLLFDKCHIHRIVLERPRLSIERGSDGVLNWARRAKPRGTLPMLDWARLSLTDGNVQYKDAASGAMVQARDLNAEVRGLRKEDRETPNPIAKYSFRAKLTCKAIRSETMSVDDVSVIGGAEHGVLALDPITMRVFGGKGSGALRAELSDSIPRYRLRYALSRFGVNECLRTLSPDTIATGVMDFSANVSLSGRAPAEWVRTLEGDAILRGQEIKLRGHDLDLDFSRFESSQNLDLMDVGSFFFVGPLGMVVTKGYDFGRLIRHSKGNTRIGAIVSSWSIRGGQLEATDVALATDKNRLALRGRLDFVNQRFDSVTVALIDKDGCAKVRQEVRGTFKEPELKKPTVLMSLLGPARKIFTRAKDLLPLGPCTVFYAGSVEPPE